MPKIGGPKRIGNIGSGRSRRGGIGNPGTTVGSSLVLNQNKAASLYPTTTTAAPTTTTTAAPTTTTAAPTTTTVAPTTTTTAAPTTTTAAPTTTTTG